MKIYAADNPNWWLPYLGKDIWVHCMWNEWNPVYIRLVAKRNSTKSSCLFNINLIEESDLEKGNYKCAFATRFLPIEDFEPIYEVDDTIKTLTELPQNVASDDTIFQKFAGKPWWIRGKNRTNNVPLYLKVLEYYSGLMKVQTVYEGYVFDYVYEFADSIPSRAIVTDIIFADIFEIDQPLELLSDEEMDEILSENDKIYYEGLAGNPDDEDEEYWED